MAYVNRNAAYDMSLFEENPEVSAAFNNRREQEKIKKSAENKAHKSGKVMSIPEEEIHKIRRRRNNPLKLFLGGICGGAVAFVIGMIIVGQVQLTELNQQIITAKSTLEECQSIYTQNEMKVVSKLSTAEVEQYAEDVLGMTKAENTQKEFVTLSGGDKAEVSSQADENLFTRFVDSISNLWS